MKLVSAILATVVFFLSIQPVLSNFIATPEAQPAHTCCMGMCKRSSASSAIPQKKNSTRCNNGHCDNPFLACSNCPFIHSDKSTFSIVSFFLPSKKTRRINDGILSCYVQDCWHPPEAV